MKILKDELNNQSTVQDIYEQAKRPNSAANAGDCPERRNLKRLVEITDSVLDPDLKNTDAWQEVLKIAEELDQQRSFTWEEWEERGFLEPLKAR